MVRSGEIRLKRYQQKMDAEVIRQRIDGLKEEMVDNATERFAVLAEIQSYVSQKLKERGVPPEFTATFMRVAMKILGLKNKHSGTTFANEATFMLNHTFCKAIKVFANTTLVANVLGDIASKFEISWTAPTKCYGQSVGGGGS